VSGLRAARKARLSPRPSTWPPICLSGSQRKRVCRMAGSSSITGNKHEIIRARYESSPELVTRFNHPALASRRCTSRRRARAVGALKIVRKRDISLSVHCECVVFDWMGGRCSASAQKKSFAPLTPKILLASAVSAAAARLKRRKIRRPARIGHNPSQYRRRRAAS
jgi:hypothetical protein